MTQNVPSTKEALGFTPLNSFPYNGNEDSYCYVAGENMEQTSQLSILLTAEEFRKRITEASDGKSLGTFEVNNVIYYATRVGGIIQEVNSNGEVVQLHVPPARRARDNYASAA